MIATAPAPDFAALAREYRDACTDEDYAHLAEDWNVPADVLRSMWVGRTTDAYTIPERDAAGVIIGIQRKLDAPIQIDGKPLGKIMVKGSRRGIAMRYPMDRYAGTSPDNPILIPEGGSDTATGEALGFTTIGRPSATGGGDILRQLVSGRHVVIVGENDGDGADDPDRPGKLGAEKTADALRDVAASVVIIYPPRGVKDLREWRNAPAGCTREEIAACVRNARREQAERDDADDIDMPISFGELLEQTGGNLREPVIHGILRRGETANIIAAPKVGKSWLLYDLALSVAADRPWLERFTVDPGPVLLLDNELHRETLSYRLPKVAEARGIALDEYRDTLKVKTLRGQLQDLHAIRRFVDRIEPGFYKLVICDAWYRFYPRDIDENSNGAMAALYNTLDSYAERIGAAFALVHHASKGIQAGKAVTDVGAGAGSQSRAADAHIVLREHEHPGAVVLDGAVRSFAPLEPFALRWSFPIWTPAPDLDPEQLRETGRKRANAASRADEIAAFVASYFTAEPRPRHEIYDAAKLNNMGDNRFKELLADAKARGLVFAWKYGTTKPQCFATVPQPRKES